jgi:outer membrane autotransporter protein
MFFPSVSRGADFLVSNGDPYGAGSLHQAILDANAAGAGNHTISLDSSMPPGSVLEVYSTMAHINANVVIDGGGSTIYGHGASRLLFVAGGNVTIKNLTFEGGNATGGNGGSADKAGGGGGSLGAGGAIYVNSGANVTVENASFTYNGARGGSGGTTNSGGSGQSGGGGGGFHGNGASGGYNGGGGGGGFLGDGGQGSTSGGAASGGGGGGGLLGDGGAGSNVLDATGGGGGGGVVLSGSDGFDVSGGLGAVPGGDGGNGGTFGASGSTGGNGLATGGGGGGGGNVDSGSSGGNGGNGGTYGGGGGGGQLAHGGTAGDFGGGGGGGAGGNGGAGTFGGGGGGAGFGSNMGGASGFGGGEGGGVYTGGGGGSGYGGAIFVRSGGSLTVINSSFSGNVVFAGAGGVGNNQNGTNGSAAGSAVYVMSGTSLNFSVSGNSQITVGDTIGGDGQVQKLGTGELILTGTNTYLGATTVDAGLLSVNGSIVSETTVGASGTLGGSGTIAANLINSGILAPGNSIGQLNVTGNYTQNSGSTLEIEIDDLGHSDVLAVDGDVDLAGALSVKGDPLGTFTAGQSYTFLTFTGNRTGTFASYTDDLAFFDILLAYNAHDVSFSLVSNSNNFMSIANTFNERGVAGVFDTNTGGPLQPLADEMLPMTSSQVQQSLTILSGDIYGSTPNMQFQNTSTQIQMISQQLGPQFSSSSGLDGANVSPIKLDGEGQIVFINDVGYQPLHKTWVIGYGLGGNARSDGNAQGLNFGLGGFLVGVERYLDEATSAGLYGGYNGAQLSTTTDQRVLANSGQVGAFFRRDTGFDYYTLLTGFSFDGYDSSRNVTVGGLPGTAEATYGGWQSVTYVERGRSYAYEAGVVQPYVALQYIYLRQNSFSETGGGAANLDVAGVDASSLRGFLGTRASREYVTSGGRVLTPQVRAAWMHEFLETDTLINNRFAAVGGGTFAIEGLDLGRDWALLGAGLGWQLNSQLTITGNYDAQINSNQTFHVGSANLQYLW